MIPLAQGGIRSASNERLAHRRCNSKKGARTGPKRKGLRRRAWRPKPKPRDLPDDVF